MNIAVHSPKFMMADIKFPRQFISDTIGMSDDRLFVRYWYLVLLLLWIMLDKGNPR